MYIKVILLYYYYYYQHYYPYLLTVSSVNMYSPSLIMARASMFDFLLFPMPLGLSVVFSPPSLARDATITLNICFCLFSVLLCLSVFPDISLWSQQGYACVRARPRYNIF